MVCRRRLKRGSTFTSRFLAATHQGTHPPSHEHIRTHTGLHTHTNPHIHSNTRLLADSTIETASAVDFLPLLNPAYFRVATPNLWAEVENRSSAQSTAPRSGQKKRKKKKAIEFTTFSSRHPNPSHCRTQTNEKLLLLWSCGDLLQN